MYSLILLDEARIEWLDSSLYYELQKKGLGEKFTNVVEKTLEQILVNPKHFQKKNSNYREAYLKPFPFVILFRVDKQKDCIVVTGIFHTKRNPLKKTRE
jgi:mRNA-degrading endonuclease RelE of RelBE toxin-antitoxin system